MNGESEHLPIDSRRVKVYLEGKDEKARARYEHLSDREMDFRSRVKDSIIFAIVFAYIIATPVISFVEARGSMFESIRVWQEQFAVPLLAVLCLGLLLSLCTPLDREVRRRNRVHWAMEKGLVPPGADPDEFYEMFVYDDEGDASDSIELEGHPVGY